MQRNKYIPARSPSRSHQAARERQPPARNSPPPAKWHISFISIHRQQSSAGKRAVRNGQKAPPRPLFPCPYSLAQLQPSKDIEVCLIPLMQRNKYLRAARRVHIRLHESADLRLGTRLRLPSGRSPSFPFNNQLQENGNMQFEKAKRLPPTRLHRPFRLSNPKVSRSIQ
jgi:hypothetical protein